VRGLTCNSAIGLQDDTNCWPTATSYPPRSKPALSGLGFYSPGLSCPTGYTSACTAISDSTARPVPTPGPINGAFQFPLVAGETAIGCCPTGYTCGTYPGYGFQGCHQVVSSTTVDALTCGNNKGSASLIGNLQVPFTTEGKTITTVDVWAPLVQINWQSTDLPSSTEATSTASTLSTTAPTTSTPLSSSAAQTSPTPTPSKGLAMSTIAGIIVAVIIILLCAISLLVYLWLRKRHLQKPTRFDAANPSSANDNTPSSSDPSFSTAPLTKTITSSTSTTAVSTNSTQKVHSMSAFSTPLYYPGHKKGFSTSTIPSTPSSRLSAQLLAFTPEDNSPIHSPTTATHPTPKDYGNEIAPLPATTYTPPPLPPSYYSPEKEISSTGMTPISTFPARLGHSLGAEDDIESPIDGTSPFRLKRGNSNKTNLALTRNASFKSVKSGRGRLVRRSGSPARLKDEQKVNGESGRKVELREREKERRGLRNRSVSAGRSDWDVDREVSRWERRSSLRGVAL
jgi:hypothetical protein